MVSTAGKCSGASVAEATCHAASELLYAIRRLRQGKPVDKATSNCQPLEGARLIAATLQSLIPINEERRDAVEPGSLATLSGSLLKSIEDAGRSAEPLG